MKTTLRRVLVLLIVLATLSAFALPASAQTLTARQQAIVDTALAYYYKGAPMQYDSMKLSKLDGGDFRSSRYAAPEDATKDNTVYTVCSSFGFEVYYNAIGFEIASTPRRTGNTALVQDNVGNIVYHHEKGTPVETVKQTIQPGDLVVACFKSRQSPGADTSGWHMMVYVGDAFGDGKDYLVHSAGSKYNTDSGQDPVENYTEKVTKNMQGCGGNIVRTDAAVYLWSADGYYYPDSVDEFYLFRPLGVADEAKYPISPAAQGRAKFPNIVINRTASVGCYGAVETGEDITYTIEIVNKSDAAYANLPVTETVPAGTKFKSVTGGGTESGGTIKWNLNVPAGETATIGYTVTVTAKRGETVTATGGTVSTIPSNTINTAVCGKKPAAMTVDEIVKASESFKTATGEAFANEFYRAAYGVELNLPAASVMARSVFAYTKAEGASAPGIMPTSTPKEGYEKLNAMIVDKYYGGKEFNTGKFNARVMDAKKGQLQPGDILYVAKNLFGLGEKTSATYIVAADGTLVNSNGKKVAAADDKTYTKLHSNDFFFALRPCQAYDDMTVEAKASEKLPFTDVKEADWFYTYVKDLYNDGTVNGMTATTFVPNGNLTYGQALKLIVCALGHGEQASTGGHWASGYLKFAQDKGWIAGDVDLNGNVTRLAFCQIAAKAKNLTEQPASNPFKDTNDTAVLALNKAGVINGMSADTFSPNGLLTRAQISKIIHTLRGV